MNIGNAYNEQVVVVAALIQLRNVAFLGVEYPAQCFFRAWYACHIVLVAEHVFAFLYVVAALGSVFLHFLECVVRSDKVAERVVCF